MSDLGDRLGRLGLGQYYAALVDNGFETWDTVVDIQEEDLQQLGFKLGHRRQLQREIASYRGLALTQALPLQSSGSHDDQSPQSCSANEAPSSRRSSTLTPPSSRTPPSQSATAVDRPAKRRYRRHPKEDKSAPKRPKTAYVNFSDYLRTDPAIYAMGFVEIAREVGRQWQLLSLNQKQAWERQAAEALRRYEEQMELYKKTGAYHEYQSYLERFHSELGSGSKQKRQCPPPDAAASREDGPASQQPAGNACVSDVSAPGASSREKCQHALEAAMSELLVLRKEFDGVRPYDRTHLPPKELTRHSIKALIDGIGSLMYVWTHEQAEALLDRVYSPESEPDALSLAEMFVAAALGGYFDTGVIPGYVRRTFFLSGTVRLDEVTEADYLRLMRILLCLSMISMIEKNMSARSFLVAGLRIARWKCPQLQEHPDCSYEQDSWRKVYRALIFVDCWLSYTLGYLPEATSLDTKYAHIPLHTEPSINDTINSQSSKIGLVAADISKSIGTTEVMDAKVVEALAAKLDNWHRNLPPIMQLAALTCPGSNLNNYQQRAILMVHMVYLGAIILLYRHLLVTPDESRSHATWTLDITYKDILEYRDRCVLAAEQVARILGLLNFDGHATQRCWLVIYWAFSACIVLLFSVAQKILDQMLGGIDQDLTYARDCIHMLQHCSDAEQIAARYLKLMQPLYGALCNIRNSMAHLSNSVTTYPTPPPTVNDNRHQVVRVHERLTELLQDPFGRNQKAPYEPRACIPTPEGSASIFWWK